MLLERAPGPSLAGDVLRYCAYEERTGTPTRQREPISTSIVLIFGLETRLGVDGERLGTFAGGLGDKCQWIEHDGAMAGVQVDVTPLAARRLLGIPMHELACRSVPLEDLVGAEARVLEERLHEAPDWPTRFDLVEGWLSARLGSAVPPPPDVTWAWRQLQETNGRTRISDITATLGCSGKHLAGRFREYVGLPAKAVARVTRFRKAAQLLGAGMPLDELAFACGYYDQSHLDRDFRDFAGATPTEYRRDPRKVTFFQDA